ncbi:hypothetical protein ABWW58_14960 [Sporolactobacillus sp. STCC-11]|uniref:hypothetical protein n=1 Tax=Sporolactobacillus caesalpiniae TaxID=3230362 RepID=UPI003399DF85
MINKRLFSMTKGARKWLFVSVLNSYLSTVFYIASLLLVAFTLRTILIGQATLLFELAAFFVLILLIIARMWTD